MNKFLIATVAAGLLMGGVSVAEAAKKKAPEAPKQEEQTIVHLMPIPGQYVMKMMAGASNGKCYLADKPQKDESFDGKPYAVIVCHLVAPDDAKSEAVPNNDGERHEKGDTGPTPHKSAAPDFGDPKNWNRINA